MNDMPHEVIVVGSGAGGGMVTYYLTRAGVNVLLLEAGRDYDPKTETPIIDIPSRLPCVASQLVGSYQ